MSQFDRFVPQNPLVKAREQHRRLSGPIATIPSELVQPPIKSPILPLVRKMGETEIERRRRRGNPSLWDNTPFKSDIKTLGAVDITKEIGGFDSVGWEWNNKSNTLNAYLNTNGETYLVKIPGERIRQIFNYCLKKHCGEYVTSPRINGVFKQASKAIKKASRGAKRAVKNPKAFLNESSKMIKTLVKDVGVRAVNVASSPIFAGVMTGLAVIPPMQAVGGAGLAAYAAANAAKPAMKALETTVDTVDAISKKKKAEKVLNNMRNGLVTMPRAGRELFEGALKSVNMPPPKRTIGNVAIRVNRQGVISRY